MFSYQKAASSLYFGDEKKKVTHDRPETTTTSSFPASRTEEAPFLWKQHTFRWPALPPPVVDICQEESVRKKKTFSLPPKELLGKDVNLGKLSSKNCFPSMFGGQLVVFGEGKKRLFSDFRLYSRELCNMEDEKIVACFFGKVKTIIQFPTTRRQDDICALP